MKFIDNKMQESGGSVETDEIQKNKIKVDEPEAIVISV